MLPKINEFFFKPSNSLNLGICRALFFGWLLYLYGSSSYFVAFQRLPTELWLPVGPFQILNERPRLEKATWQWLHWLWTASLLFSMIGLFSRASLFLSGILGFVLIGHSYCYGYITHTFLPIVFSLIILMVSRAGDGFSFDSLIRKRFKKMTALRESFEYTWPVRSIQLIFCLAFFSAGFSKMWNGGFEWILSNNLQMIFQQSYFLYPDVNTWASSFRFNELLVRSPIVCQVLAGAIVLLELSAPLALFSRRLMPVLVVSFGLFQIATYFTIYVNFRIYLCLYFFWVPWDHFFLRIQGWIRNLTFR